MSPMRLYVGDVLRLRKTHPCGSDIWEVLRAGMDFRIKCRLCGRVVLLPRVKLEKDIKEIISSNGPSESV